MKANAFLLTLFTFLLATSCSNKALEPIQPPDYEAEIVGDWLWLESCGGIAGNCEYSTEFPQEGISFGENGSFFAWGTLIDPMDGITYKIVQKISYSYGQDTIVTAIERRHETQTFVDLIIMQLDDNGLMFIRDCGDCYMSTYFRIRTTDITIVDPGGVGP